MTTSSKITLGLWIAILIIAIAIFRPVPIVKESKALSVSGVVEHISESGVHDVTLLLKNDNRTFYINRGLEYNLTISGLREKLMGEEVTMKYPRYWTPLDWNSRIRHVSKLKFKEEILFNELR